ncbi:Non-specific lipid transfer protein GPI-anchored 1 [Morella rubra]|uniref:Non-specific lipid transfer protein GPI-anchored 1 n=1 Tax=Morella rubra TaxID=262757 RepID=A0A6A1WMR0_9ROSI|nr:Non-specific lipid transfer protein GPI-anchored 1 [Morella rubra]
MKARLTNLFLFFLVLFFCGLVCKVRAADLATKCSEDFDKVVKCLNFVTAKEATPTKDCCTSISEIRDKNPECLCFFILQTRNGSEQIKNLGIQEARLLQLPTACSLKNASISNCPRLLGLSPTSPDAAIFTNASATITGPASTATPASSSETANVSNTGSRQLGPHLAGLLAVAIITIFIFALPAGLCHHL